MAMLPKMPLLLFVFHHLLLLLDASPSHHLSPTFLPNYNKMLHTFKIHIYNHTPPSSITYHNPTASHFYNLLHRSPFLTSDPNQAHLFFLPFSSHLSSTRPIARLVREIRTELPYWNRTLGADHFYISCDGFGSGSSDRNLLELKKNSIQISCFPTTESSNFIPHKDITLPPLHPNLNSKTVNDSVNELVNDREMMSKYCPLFYEDGSVGRIGSSMRAGCVPLVAVDGSNAAGQDLPMMDVVRWGEVAVFVRNGTTKEEVRRVVGAREGGYERMRELGVAAAQHFEWDGGEEQHGAFWSVMYQLWMRRHVIRYARVESS